MRCTRSGRAGKNYGVDIDNEGICDTFAKHVWEPAMSKANSISSATEAACLILSVDETVRNPKSEQPDASQVAPGGRGAPLSAAMGGAGLKGLLPGGGRGRGRGMRAMRGRGGR